MQSLSVNQKLKQLRWQCRRGMLEIDLLLQRYLSDRYIGAPLDDQRIFELLLCENDQDLFFWLTGHAPAPKKYENIIERIRE